MLTIRYCQTKFPWLITGTANEPEIDKDTIDWFFENSYDQDLGWSPKPFNSGEDNTDDGIKKYTINKNGARYNPNFEEKSSNIAVFGDSFAFGRLVNDDETWPHLLSKKMNTNVLNYAVGNYGLDQAYLRLKREIKTLESDIIIMSVVPETISRIHSYWKHYFEYGNTLAFKPIFQLRNDELFLHEQFIRDKESFKKISQKGENIRSLDYFYESKFLKDILKFPYTFNLLRTKDRSIPIIIEILKGEIFKNREEAYRAAFKIVIDRNAEHTARLYQSENHLKLLLRLAKEFVNLCETNDKRPIFLFSPQPIDLQRMNKGKNDYHIAFKKISSFTEAIDLSIPLMSYDSFKEFYIEGSLGPHFSIKGNSVSADFISEYLETN